MPGDDYSELRINSDRLLAEMDDLAAIGATPDGGVNRPAFSNADLEARRWFRKSAEEAGLEFRQDGAGNLSAVLPAANAESAPKTILCGSHLDSVPKGGRYDGALGVITALEVVRTLKESGIRLPVNVEAVNFSDEEGSWISLFGSRALTGILNQDILNNPKGGSQAFEARLAAAGLTKAGALASTRDPSMIKAWVECHIEQGTKLEESGSAIGIVSGVVGIAMYWLNFIGRADHAGTTPMDRRLDALRGVAAFVGQVRELVINRFPQGVCNCGMVEVEPGAHNIIPERAKLALEFRHSDPGALDAMREALINLALHVVEVEGLSLEVEQIGLHEPALTDREVSTAIETACKKLGLSSIHMPSYAGHDTQNMAAITQAGMFFVPSVEGASHSPREFTPDEDCINAGNVLLHTVLGLALAE
ncbi:MAG: Zn-dependent hydrolase [Anaerolineae bacterium]|nr:Zn-dependent hydrolase [Anaerolineae bacterium]